MNIQFEWCKGGFRISKVVSNDPALILPSHHLLMPVIEIGKNALAGCQIEMVRLPKKTMVIREGAFAGCKKLEGVIAFNDLMFIEDDAFSECRALTKVDFSYCPLVTVGARAFKGCRELESIELPDSVNDVGPEAFFGCRKLKRFRNPSSNRVVETETFGHSGLEEIDGLDGVEVRENAFADTPFERRSVNHDVCSTAG